MLLNEYRNSIPEIFPAYANLSGKNRLDFENQLKLFRPEEWSFLKKVALENATQKPNTVAWEPPSFFSLKDRKINSSRWEKVKKIGENFVSAGKVGLLTVAGGQGTRLGFDGPKGTLAVTPIRKKSLFQIFAEKILAAERAFGHPMHWFVMTSPENHEATFQYFQKTNIFPLERLHLFQQGTLPIFDFSGQCLLESSHKLCFGPDGHGGIFKALYKSGCLDEMKALNIEILSYIQVDNPLVTAIDLGFIGLHAEVDSEMSSKVVRKRSVDEKVGIFVQENQQLKVVEYSDMPLEMANKKNPDGQYCFELGNVAIHLLNRRFIEKILASGDLPLHVARKVTPFIDNFGTMVTPLSPNALKLERFVFDALPFAKKTLLLEIDRDEEFSPVKNLSGMDSLDTCIKDQTKRHQKWLKSLGNKNYIDDTLLNSLKIEISPLFADDVESFVERWTQLDKKPEIRTPFYLE